MSIPAYRTESSTGATDAGSGWTYSATSAGAIGNVVIFQVLQDGATSEAVAITSASDIEDLAGNDNAVTYIGAFPVGASGEAIQHLWIGRAINTSGPPTISGTNSTSEDLYMMAYEFSSVNAGTTLASVIENGSAGATVNEVGTSATRSDADVTTLGPDRLALNFLAINDDNTIAAITGESGGDWATCTQFASSTGTDGTVRAERMNVLTASTVGGGTGSITDSDAWGVVGFALIGTTVAAKAPPFAPVHHHLLRR